MLVPLAGFLRLWGSPDFTKFPKRHRGSISDHLAGNLNNLQDKRSLTKNLSCVDALSVSVGKKSSACSVRNPHNKRPHTEISALLASDEVNETNLTENG